MLPLRHKQGSVGDTCLLHENCWPSCCCKVDYQSWAFGLFSVPQEASFPMPNTVLRRLCVLQHTLQACAGTTVLQMWGLSSMVNYPTQRHTSKP